MQVTFVSTGRADLGGLMEVLRATAAFPSLQARIVLAGDPAVGEEEIRNEGLSSSIVALPQPNDSRAASRIAGLIPALLADVQAHPPDVILILGDRYELLAVLSVAISERVPLAHISGGEITIGALDEQVRHAVTKAAHVHFVAHPEFAQRVRRMGEEDWRVHLTGDPGLDRVRRADVSSPGELAAFLGHTIDRGTIMIALHPVTNAPDETWHLWKALTEALAEYPGMIIVTAPNADPQGDELRQREIAWCSEGSNRRFIPHLGQRHFMAMLRHAGCLLGNSSAAIWEAPSLASPAINLGRRQDGRLRGANVIDLAAPSADAIAEALQRALQPDFRARLRGEPNPYGDGHSAGRIAEVLENLPARARLLEKHFSR